MSPLKHSQVQPLPHVHSWVFVWVTPFSTQGVTGGPPQVEPMLNTTPRLHARALQPSAVSHEVPLSWITPLSKHQEKPESGERDQSLLTLGSPT
jgi:hypothetical protein